MSDTIVNGTQMNVDNIKYSSPKANASGGKSINIMNKQTNSGLRIITPLMLTWGASDFQDPQTGKGNGKFELSLQFPSEDYKTDETSTFLNNMIKLENKIKDDALTNSKEWFGKVHKNVEVVEALYTPMLKYSKDKMTGEPDYNRPPVLRVKIPTWEGVWKCEIYDEDANKMFPDPVNSIITPIDLIQKGINVIVLMQCGGLWFANGKFGVTWKLIQAVVQKPKATLTGQCFISVKPADKAKLKTATTTQQKVGALVDDENVAQVDESDDEDDERMSLKENATSIASRVEKSEDELVVEPEEEIIIPSTSTTVVDVSQSVAGSEESSKKKKVVRKK